MNSVFTLKNLSFLAFSAAISALYVCTVLSLTFVGTSKSKPQIEKYKTIFQTQSNSIFTTIEKSILSRNIFNKTGEIPLENTLDGNSANTLKNFDQVACSPDAKLPFELVGVIYSSNPNSTLVTLKDSAASMSDVYKVGQSIAGYEAYSIYKVTGPKDVQFKYGNKKICASLLKDDIEASPNASPSQPENTYQLSAGYINSELGAGFSKILTTAQLIPEISDGKVVGFKLSDVAEDSLFDRLGLENGDIITNVNDINLEDSSQGFKIYETFQEEGNITLKIIRNGTVVIKKVTVQ